MLTSLLRSWFRPALSAQEPPPMCVPEWSEPMAEHHASIWWQVKPYTRTSVERVVALCQSIAYLHHRQIPGDIVECGGRGGGNMMASALALLALESTTRQLHMYETFKCSLHDVKQALMQTRYPWEKMLFVQGRVDETLPKYVPEEIALLRLGEDGYETTYHELEHLYPRLVDGGVLIVDDDEGTRKAVDDYLRDQGIDADLRTIDHTGRLLLKPARQTVSMAA